MLQNATLCSEILIGFLLAYLCLIAFAFGSQKILINAFIILFFQSGNDLWNTQVDCQGNTSYPVSVGWLCIKWPWASMCLSRLLTQPSPHLTFACSVCPYWLHSLFLYPSSYCHAFFSPDSVCVGKGFHANIILFR